MPEENGLETSEKAMLNPWTAIWMRPRATIQEIVATNPDKHVLALAGIAGVAQALDRASTQNAGDRMGVGTILAVALLAGPLLGIIGLYLWGLLTRWTGRWIGGQASARDIRAATAWSSVPVVLASVLWVPMLLLVGRDLFTSETPRMDANPMVALWILLLFAIQFVAAIWSIIVFCKCLGQVQGFSAWRGLGNSVLAGLVIVVPIIAVVFGLAMLPR